MQIFTIGFTKTTAENFFQRLQNANTHKIIDVRLNNVSQLAGFAKSKDLQYFSKTICNMDYEHLPVLAPTKDILDTYKKHKGSWQDYENAFFDLMKKRKIEKLNPHTLDGACLLCSEDTPHHCHRRLVVEYLQHKWGNLDIIHL